MSEKHKPNIDQKTLHLLTFSFMTFISW